MSLLFRTTTALLTRVQGQLRHASNAAPAAKSNLAVLRRNTGYSFSLCKKALEANSNDVQAAEEWLNKQAANLEWSKNKNVAARKTNQGLIALLIRGQAGSLIELNCETDFVARNENFLSLLNLSAQTCTQFVEQNMQASSEHLKTPLDVEILKTATVNETGKSLQDHINLSIETIKENITFGRALGFRVPDNVQLHGCTHPIGAMSDGNVFYGKYGAIVALQGSSVQKDFPKGLCQHIVGMNPKRIGKEGVDEPNADADSEECLIFQEYMLDPSKTVHEVLQENQIELLDFHRYGCDDEKN